MTKAQLKAFRALKQERDDLLHTLDELDAILYGPKVSNLTGMPAGGGEPGSVIERKVEAHAEKRDEVAAIYAAKVAEIETKLIEVEQAIERLQPRERTLIRMHYIQGMTWEEVCIAMNYSWRQVHRIHANALIELDK